MIMADIVAAIDKRLDILLSSSQTKRSHETREQLAMTLLDLRAVALGDAAYDIHVAMRQFMQNHVDDAVAAAPMYARGLPNLLFTELLSHFINEQRALQKAV
jgi:hypothetical protein